MYSTPEPNESVLPRTTLRSPANNLWFPLSTQTDGDLCEFSKEEIALRRSNAPFVVEIRYVEPRPLGSLVFDLWSHFSIHISSASTSSDMVVERSLKLLSNRLMEDAVRGGH